jgi:hypothetical protein
VSGRQSGGMAECLHLKGRECGCEGVAALVVVKKMVARSAKVLVVGNRR